MQGTTDWRDTCAHGDEAAHVARGNPRRFHLYLHQTWADGTTPPQFASYVASWAKHEARLARTLADDVACRQGVEAYAPHLLATYDALPAHIMRVDMWRYVVLLHDGGIYADLDVECTSPVDALLEPGVHLVLEDIRPGQETIGNALMSSSRGHPFWVHVLRELQARAHRVRAWDAMTPEGQRSAVLCTTGPYMLTDALASWRGGGVTVHEQGTVGAVHHRVGSWWRSRL